MNAFTPDKQAQLNALGMTIAGKVREYFRDAAHRREFETWYAQKYGKQYVWKKVKV